MSPSEGTFLEAVAPTSPILLLAVLGPPPSRSLPGVRLCSPSPAAPRLRCARPGRPCPALTRSQGHGRFQTCPSATPPPVTNARPVAPLLSPQTLLLPLPPGPELSSASRSKGRWPGFLRHLQKAKAMHPASPLHLDTWRPLHRPPLSSSHVERSGLPPCQSRFLTSVLNPFAVGCRL